MDLRQIAAIALDEAGYAVDAPQGIAREYTRAFQEADGEEGQRSEVKGQTVEVKDTTVNLKPQTVTDESPEVKNLRHLLRTNAISKKDFASGIAALAALGKISKGRVSLIKRQMFVEDEGEEGQRSEVRGQTADGSVSIRSDEDVASPTEDSAPDNSTLNTQPSTDLEKHDAKYHNGQYDGKSACKYREEKAKGDNVDNLDPENVEGEVVEGQRSEVRGQTEESSNSAVQPQPSTSTSATTSVSNAKADLDAKLKTGNLKDIGDALDGYEKAYNAASGGKVVACLQGLLGKLKSQTGIVAKIVNQQIAQAKAQSAASNLPQGTMTPDEARNYAALEIAKQLGAKLTAGATAGVAAAGAGGSLTGATGATGGQGASVASGSGVTHPVSPVSPATQFNQPAAPPTTNNQQPTISYGPHVPLQHNFTQLPAGMNLDDFASWPRGGGSTGLRIYTDPNTGKKYGVKKSGGMPGGDNIPKLVLAEDWMADQALRMAGLNAPDGIIETNPTDGEYYKITEWNDNIKSGIGEYGLPSYVPGHEQQLAEGYPMMAFLYNMDASQNGVNMLIDNNGDLVYVDNGSSFGNRAKGGINKWYVDRDDADSTKSSGGIAQLAQYVDQKMWSNALGVNSISGTYGKTISSADQDKILKEAAKYEMGKIARNVVAEMTSRFGVKPTDDKYKNLVKWADSLDALAAKYKTGATGVTVATGGQGTSVASGSGVTPPVSQVSPASQVNHPASQPTTNSPSSTGNTATQPASHAAASQAQSGTPQSATMASNGSALLNQVGNSSWNTHPTGRALRNAVTIANAMALLPSHQTQVANAFNAILQGQFSANGRGVGGTVTGVNIPRKGVQALQKAMNAHLAKSGLKVQIHKNGNVSIGATNKAIANAALAASGQPTGGTTANDEAIAADEAPKGVFAMAVEEVGQF